MENRWYQLSEKLMSSLPNRRKWWQLILTQLDSTSEHTRSFYNLHYLERRFLLYDEWVDRLSNPTAVALAMFFQHLYYDPRIEGASHELTMNSLTNLAADADLASKEYLSEVEKLLECAALNSTPAHLTANDFGNEDVHYFLDFDSKILGSCDIEYADYVAKIREDYNFLPDNEYFSLRLKILKYFLQIPNIFATKCFRNQYELQARLNISKEIESIESSQ